VSTDHHSLDYLLAPTDRSAFFAEHWEKAPLVLQRHEPAYYEELLASGDLDYILASACSVQSSSIELLRDGHSVRCKQDEGPAEIYQAYQQGHSVRVRGVQRLWPQMWRLCRNLQRDFGFPVKANLYCTPAHSKGTLRHHDCHDVFVVQVAGRKRWRISESVPHLPLQYVPSLPFEKSEVLFGLRGGAPLRQAAAGESDEPSREVTLEPGDSLYLPRGTAHTVWAEDSPSAHVTIGIYAITLLDLMSVALGQVANQDIRFRKSVPIGSTAGLSADQTLTDTFQSLLKAFSERADVATALDEVAGSFVSGMQAFGDGALMESSDPAGLSPDAEVQWWPGAAFRLTTLNGSVGLASCDATFTLPEAFGEPVRFIAQRPRFKIKELPGGMSPRSKVALVRQLIAKKFLQRRSPEQA
jgi:ribosomal protein L16 Arg81 hydroxylase